MKEYGEYSFIQYFWRGYGYLLVCWLPIASFFGLGIITPPFLLNDLSNEFGLTIPTIFNFIEGTVVILLPVILTAFAYKISKKSQSQLHHKLIIFTVLSILLFVVAFLINAGLGGASQAVVEGVAGPAWKRYITYLVLACAATLMLSPLSLLFSLVGDYRLRHYSNKKANIVFNILLVIIPIILIIFWEINLKRMDAEYEQWQYNSFTKVSRNIKAGEIIKHSDIYQIHSEAGYKIENYPINAIKGSDDFNVTSDNYRALVDIPKDSFIPWDFVEKVAE